VKPDNDNREGASTISHPFNHRCTISADLKIPAGGAQVVIVAEADHLDG
jgi:hypothetical protein